MGTRSAHVQKVNSGDGDWSWSTPQQVCRPPGESEGFLWGGGHAIHSVSTPVTKGQATPNKQVCAFQVTSRVSRRSTHSQPSRFGNQFAFQTFLHSGQHNGENAPKAPAHSVWAAPTRERSDPEGERRHGRWVGTPVGASSLQPRVSVTRTGRSVCPHPRLLEKS